MLPFWISFWSILELSSGSSDPVRCPLIPHESPSALLDSLRCYNNYRSYVQCEWSNPGNVSVKLWLETRSKREECLPYSGPEGRASGPGAARCRYNTNVLVIGVSHTAFFVVDEERMCQHAPVNLSQILRTQPPDRLSIHDDGDEGCRLVWSGPYPSSSSLNRDTEYQLNYRVDGGDGGGEWRTLDLHNTSARLERQPLLPGCRYEARVRAKAGVAQWSHWSPAAARRTDKAGGCAHCLRCVLAREGEVKCTWEVNADVSQVATHQLLCHRNRTAPPQNCCVNQCMDSEPGGRVVKHSCWLDAADVGSTLLELLPRRRVRTFKACEHIRYDPPEQVTVTEKDSYWVVEWKDPDKEPKPSYQLCYYRKQEACSLQNISEGTTSMNILHTSLVPSQEYQVKVRSLIALRDQPVYRGVPSEWSRPVMWTSREATWSPTTLIYLSISMFVATVFFMIYCAVIACQRKVVLWVDSIPSPAKSNIMSELEVRAGDLSTQTLLRKPFRGKDQHFDSVSTCSTDVSLWSGKNGEPRHSHQDDGCWECDKQAFVCDHGGGADTSFMGFSGLYILCWESQLEEVRVTASSPENPAALNFTVGERDYVHLPSCTTSSAQQYFTCCKVRTNPCQEHSKEQQQQLDTKQTPEEVEVEDEPDPAEPLSDSPCSGSPPAYTPEGFTGWIQGVSVQSSGYCQLPTGHG